MSALVGIDQGTSGTTVLVTDLQLKIRATATREIQTIHSGDGGAEQDPWEVLRSVVEASSQALSCLGPGDSVSAAGLGHQGETVMAWDPTTLEPLTPAIVWSDRRAEIVVRELEREGSAERILQLSGMRLDAYLCAAKYRWLLGFFGEAADRVKRGRRLAVGTLDTWILLQLGAPFATDIGTASRTQLTRLGADTWDAELLQMFSISRSWLAPIEPSLGFRGVLRHESWSHPVPLACVVVDQPAALVGNGCLNPGDLKVTYGTGAFVVANAGREQPKAEPSLIASVGWGDAIGPVYTLDGGVLSVGSAISWLSDLGLDVTPTAHERLTHRPPTPVRVLPALNGLGAPRWNRGARAVISGLTAATTGDEILQATLDGCAFRVREIVEAMNTAGLPIGEVIHVDGGLTRSAYLVQRQADILGLPLAVSPDGEATALGTAAMAGLGSQIFNEGEIIAALPAAGTVAPQRTAEAEQEYQSWLRFLHWANTEPDRGTTSPDSGSN